MDLMPKELEEKFKDFPLYSQDGKGFDAEIVVKYFNAHGAGTWLITEGEKQEDGNWLFFGYCHIFEWEWGSVRLSDLSSLPFTEHINIERDLYIKEHTTIRDLLKIEEGE